MSENEKPMRRAAENDGEREPVQKKAKPVQSGRSGSGEGFPRWALVAIAVILVAVIIGLVIALTHKSAATTEQSAPANQVVSVEATPVVVHAEGATNS